MNVPKLNLNRELCNSNVTLTMALNDYHLDASQAAAFANDLIEGNITPYYFLNRGLI